MRGHGSLSQEEWAQLDAELARLPTPAPHRRRAWAALLCGLTAFCTIVLGVLM